jgi:hypothetical protein|tara:strand:- start:386 stop:574 length:189 start_codon:yes stop_codon:yes gene_type:complete
MVQVLSEFYGDRPKATVQLVNVGQATMFEVLWEGESVGTYNTEQEAENIAENYALGSAISRT